MGLAGAAGVALPSLLRRAGAVEVAGAPPTGHPATEPRVLVDWHSHFVDPGREHQWYPEPAAAVAALDKSLTELERQLIYVDNSRQLLRAKGFV